MNYMMNDKVSYRDKQNDSNFSQDDAIFSI
jgi:hypothetical protein